MEMERQQQGPTNRTMMGNRLSYSRDGSLFSGRGSGSGENGVNLFYVEELERQNDQLMRENRRLNEIIMKRLKHSIAE